MMASNSVTLSTNPLYGVRRGTLYTLLRRAPRPVWLTVIIIGLIEYMAYVSLGQWRSGLDNLYYGPADLRTIGFPIILTTALAAVYYVERATEAMLRDIRPVVQIDDHTYAAFAQDCLRAPLKMEAAWTLFSLIIGPLAAFSSIEVVDDPILRGYVLLVTAIVAVMIGLTSDAVLRGVRAIQKLQKYPLFIDIFDTDDLAPIARLGLRMSITAVSIPGFLFFFWGSVLAFKPLTATIFALIGLASFLLPLRSLHYQMVAAKARELEVVQTALRLAHERMKNVEPGQERNSAQTLGHIIAWESRVASAPTWPFNLVMVGQLAATVLIPLALTLLQIISARW